MLASAFAGSCSLDPASALRGAPGMDTLLIPTHSLILMLVEQISAWPCAQDPETTCAGYVEASHTHNIMHVER